MVKESSGCVVVKKFSRWSSHCGHLVKNLTSVHEDVGSIPDLTQWVKDPELLQGVVHRYGLDLVSAGSYSSDLTP